MSAPTERCFSCGGNHPAGCAYKGANLGLFLRCPRCDGVSFEAVNQHSCGSSTVAILQCGGCNYQWEVDVFLRPHRQSTDSTDAGRRWHQENGAETKRRWRAKKRAEMAEAS